MFAPPLADARKKAGLSPTNWQAFRHPAVVAHRQTEGGRAYVGNQATLRRLSRAYGPRSTDQGGTRQQGGVCACGGRCSKCRSGSRHDAASPDVSARAPAGTDDLAQTDLTVPRADGDAGAPSPAPSPVPADAGAPAPSCCDQAFTKGLAGTDYGGVICCNNVKHSCIWPSNMSAALTNAKAKSISIDCARVHEDTHHDDIDCTGAAVERPGFKAGKNARAEECIAYKAEVACFDAHLVDCGDDADCKTQIRDRRATKKGQADANCA